MVEIGAQFGSVITFPLSGMLCQYGFDGGWPTPFYVLGSLGVIWWVFWVTLISDSTRSGQLQTDFNKESYKKVTFHSVILTFRNCILT